MSRPIGRRCKNRHRHAWVVGAADGKRILDAAWLWCEDCGAIRPKNAPEGARWAYPGDREKALVASETWAVTKSVTPDESAQVSAAQDD